MTKTTPRRRGGLNFLRRPNAELSALSLEIDLGAISLAEGLRAALATATLIAINQWLHQPLLDVVAIGALFSCLCDVGGPMGRRLATILSFVAGGSLLFVLFGVARAEAPWVVLPAACVMLFANAMARSWGQNSMQVGNMLSVVLIFAIDLPQSWAPALLTGGAFAAGGLWALVLTLILWPLKPYQPARRAVAGVYRQVAAMADDMKSVAETDTAPPGVWDDHATAHRRTVRDAIELARGVVDQIASIRGPQSGATVQSPIRLEAADEIFGALIGLSSVLETNAAARPVACRVLRLLGPLLRSIADAIEHDTDPNTVAVGRGIATVAEIGAGQPPLAGVFSELAERLRLAVSVAGPVVADMAPEDVEFSPHPLWERLHDRLASELTWSSAVFRHATRTALLATLTIAASLWFHQYYAHWMSITLVVTLQPFYANTRLRAIERTIGTSLGVLGVSLLAMALHTPLAVAAALVQITVVAFALRRVSFTLFISGLTPFVVLLVELGHRGEGTIGIAVLRMAYTFAGGLLAVLGNRYLWPLWEPSRLREELVKALQAHALWVMADKSDDTVRRQAGRCSNALETSIARALAEPRATRDRGPELAMIADAALRRIGGHLTAVALQTRREPPDMRWRGWIAGSLRALAETGPNPPRPPHPPPEPLAPIVRQVELVTGAWSRASKEGNREGKEVFFS